MTDPMLKITVDQIIEASPLLPDTPELREALGLAYQSGAFEAAVAPSAPGDPAAAEREATNFAVAATLALKTGALPPLQAALDAHLKRKGMTINREED
jgi:hypothetical protein